MKRPRVEYLNADKKAGRGENFSLRRTILIFVVALILIFLSVKELVKPVELRISDRYLTRGDQYFVGMEYDKAQKEYLKALKSNPDNATANKHLELSKIAPARIADAREFFLEKGKTDVVAQIDLAIKDYDNPKEALAMGVAFYQKGEWALAQYPLQRAVSLDADYPEAWHYLGLTYERLGSIDAGYAQKSVEAFKERDSLTPEYSKD